MAAADILHATARSYGAELIRDRSSASTPIDPPAAWFSPPNVGDTIIVVAGGQAHNQEENFHQALRTAWEIHNSPQRPDNVTVVAFPNTTNNDQRVARELKEFIEIFDLRLAEFSQIDPQPLAPASRNLVVMPLHRTPFAHTRDCEREPGSHLPVSAIVVPPLDNYWLTQTHMVSDRIGLVQAVQGWERDASMWEELATSIRIAQGVLELESDARRNSRLAVKALPEPRSLFSQGELPSYEIVVGSHSHEGQLPVHAVLETRPTNGIELVPGGLPEKELSRLLTARTKQGIGVVTFDTPNPPSGFVTEVGRQLREATGLPVQEPSPPSAGRPPRFDLSSSPLWQAVHGRPQKGNRTTR